MIYGLKSQPVKKFASALLRFQSETKVDLARGERIKCCLIARHVFGYNRGRGTKTKSVRYSSWKQDVVEREVVLVVFEMARARERMRLLGGFPRS